MKLEGVTRRVSWLINIADVEKIPSNSGHQNIDTSIEIDSESNVQQADETKSYRVSSQTYCQSEHE